MIPGGSIYCFGEVLLRLAAPPGEMLLQTPGLEVAVGGAEANVAVGLARAGAPVAMLSILPDNPLGCAARDALRRYGVDTGYIRFAPGRMGLYFLTPGAVLRPSKVFYDRSASAFAVAVAQPDLIDWAKTLRGAAHLHLSGITAALGDQAAAAALGAAQTATNLGISVSFDGNYRAMLWAGREGRAPALLRALVAEAQTAFIDHRDIALILGLPAVMDSPQHDYIMAAAFSAFPRLRRIAFTTRVTHAANRHVFSGHLLSRDGAMLSSPAQHLEGVVDRVGAGDAFAAGILYGLWRGLADRETLNYGVASACLKHSVVGDAGLATSADLDDFLAGGWDIRR